VVAYSPFGSNKFPGPLSKRGRLLKKIAHEYGASARCLALRFLLDKGRVHTIPKASKVKHVEDNAKAYSLRLDDDSVQLIDESFPV